MLRTYDESRERAALTEAVRSFPVEWFVQDEWRLLRQALGDLCVISSGVALTLAFPSLWLCIPVWIVVAARMHALAVLMHDLGHYTHLKRHPLWRLFLDGIVCYPILMNVDYYAYAHDLHHQYSNIPGKDPYFFPVNRQGVLSFFFSVLAFTVFLPVWMILRLALYPLSLVLPPFRRWHAKAYGQFGAAPDLNDPERLAASMAIWPQALGPTVFWYAAAALITARGWWPAFGWGYAIPLVLASTIGYVRLCCDHIYVEARNNSIPEQLDGSTNIEAPWWQEVLLAPHGAGYHGMHHVAPKVPNWLWKTAHSRLKESGSEVYRASIFPGYGAVFAKLLRDQRQWARDRRGGEHSPDLDTAASEKPPRVHPLAEIDLLSTGPDAERHKRFVVPPIAEINRASKVNRFSEDDINWRPTDPERFHAPESLSHLAYTSVYSELTPEERLTYNHAFADGLSEQFAFLEEELLVRGLKSFLSKAGKSQTADMVEACDFFIEEEEKHSKGFRRLLMESRPEVYEKNRFNVYRLSPGERRFLDVSMDHPTFFLWWVWVATLFEEKTMEFHKAYQANRETVDSLYQEVHKYHAMDELRHFQMDHHFIHALWEPAPAWKKRLNVHLFERMMWSFAHPRRTVTAAVNVLVQRHPRLEPMRDRLIREGMEVAHDRRWHECTYSRTTLPETFHLFDMHPELHGMSRIFPLYEPRPRPPLH